MLRDAVVFARGVDERAALGDGEGEGFFDVDVLAVAHRVDRDERVPVVGRADEDDVEIGAAVELAEIAVGFAVGITVFLIYAGGGGIAAGAIHIAHGDHADGFGRAEQGAVVAIGDVAAADDADGDFLARGVLAAEAGGQDERGSDDGGGDGRMLKELAASERQRGVHGASGFGVGEAFEGAGGGFTHDGGFGGGVLQGGEGGCGGRVAADADAADKARFGGVGKRAEGVAKRGVGFGADDAFEGVASGIGGLVSAEQGSERGHALAEATIASI